MKVPIKEEYERCIMCGKMTSIPISMPVNLRENYEIGCGQICDECAEKQRKAEENEIILTTAQILRAVEDGPNETKD